MNRLSYCTYIRIIAMASIVLCHVVQHHPNLYVQMSSQFFNIGVQIFFCLSGFLLGYKGNMRPIGTWYKKRMKRIYIPWLLFVAVLAIIHLCKGNNIFTWNWLRLLFGLQGTEVGVPGAGHTWFITSLLLCYALTPLLNACIQRVKPRITCILLAIAPITFAFFPINVFTLICPVCWYGIAYIAGQKYSERWLNQRNGVIALLIALSALIIRFVVRFFTENPIVYYKLCVNYTQFVAAAGIMLFLAVLLKDTRVGRFCSYISDISFELYLYHYMLCVGPISIFALGLPWIWSAILVVVCTVGMAATAHFVTNNCLERKLLIIRTNT